MKKASDFTPSYLHTITPCLILKDAAQAIEFYKKVFAAEELNRILMPNNLIMHSCLKIGTSHIFISDEMPGGECGSSPSTLKTFHATMHVFVKNVDEVFQRAVEAGAQGVMPPQEMFWGDRYGRILDPFGQSWSIATHELELTPEEIQQRSDEFMKQMCGAAAK